MSWLFKHFLAMPIYAIFLLVILNCLPASGQRKVVVLDARNHIPVVGASVCTGGTAVLTDRGGVVLLPEIGDTVAFMHRHYFSERLQRFELRDTIFMERNEQMKTIELPEVTIEELSPQQKALIGSWARAGALIGAAEAPKGIANFDLALMLDRRGRRDRQHLEKAKEVLKKWDKKPLYHGDR